MGATLATMLTLTTYGNWLRGDARGWVEDGITYPPDPIQEIFDDARMKHPRYRFPKDVRWAVGDAIGKSLVERLNLRVYAMCVQSWHSHIVFGATAHSVGAVVKCAKDAARWLLRVDQPIWCEGYDKRFCFDVASALNRIAYVERHNLEDGLVARPWIWVTDFER